MQMPVPPLRAIWLKHLASVAARAGGRASARLVVFLTLGVSFAVVLMGLSFGFAFGGATVSDSPAENALLAEVGSALDMNSLLINPYIARPTGQRADPVNLIFIGTSDAAVVGNLVTNVFGWRDNDGGTMFFAQRGEIAGQDGQVASATRDGKRYHIRLKSGVGTIEGQPFVLGAVHMDFTVSCGHVGREFNESRNLVLSELTKRGYQTEKLFWENTETNRHCDGSDTRSDGEVVIVRLEYPPIP